MTRVLYGMGGVHPDGAAVKQLSAAAAHAFKKQLDALAAQSHKTRTARRRARAAVKLALDLQVEHRAARLRREAEMEARQQSFTQRVRDRATMLLGGITDAGVLPGRTAYGLGGRLQSDVDEACILHAACP